MGPLIAHDQPASGCIVAIHSNRIQLNHDGEITAELMVLEIVLDLQPPNDHAPASIRYHYLILQTLLVFSLVELQAILLPAGGEVAKRDFCLSDESQYD